MKYLSVSSDVNIETEVNITNSFPLDNIWYGIVLEKKEFSYDLASDIGANYKMFWRYLQEGY